MRSSAVRYWFLEVKKLLGEKVFFVFLVLCVCLNIGLCFSAPGAREAVRRVSAGAAFEEETPVGEAQVEELFTTGEKIYDTLSAEFIGSFYYDERYINSSVLNRWMKAKYEKLQASIDRLDAQDADLSPFAGEMTPLVHEALFGRQMKAILAECMILVSLLALRSFSIERQQVVASLVYSSRRGRKIARDKVAANGIVGGMYSLILAGISLTVFFVSWDFSGLWDADMASSFHYVMDANDPVLAKPFITWTDFTLKKYFLCSAALSVFVIFAWWLMTNWVAVTVQNGRAAGMLLAGMSVLPIFGLILLPKLGLCRLFYLDTLTLPAVVYCNQWWFTDLGNYWLFAYQEVWAVAAHALTVVVSLRFGLCFFKRKEIL